MSRQISSIDNCSGSRNLNSFQLILSLILASYQGMDLLINTFKSIQLSVSEIILQLQSITLPQDDIEKCQESLKESNIIAVLSTIQELTECRRPTNKVI